MIYVNANNVLNIKFERNLNLRRFVDCNQENNAFSNEKLSKCFVSNRKLQNYTLNHYLGPS